MTTVYSQLPNQLRVVTERIPHLETVSVGVWVGVGSRNEELEVNGVSHLLEHMAFKGTKRRSAQDIAEEIEAVGGHVNAYTSREQTAYYVKVLKKDVALGVDILADILQNSVFANKELVRERSVVLQEIAQTIDTPDDIIFDQFQEVAFPNQPIGRSILGPVDQVSEYSRDTLENYMFSHYSASRMVVVAAGNVDPMLFEEIVGQKFNEISGLQRRKIEPAKYIGGEVRSEKDLEQAHIIVGFEGFKYEDSDFYAMQILSMLLGGGMSSRLFQEVREKRGLAYSIFSFTTSYADTGTFGVYCGTAPDKLQELVPVLSDELNAVVDGVSHDELARAIAQIKSGILMSLESSSSRCERIARQILIFERCIPIEEMVQKLEAVTIEDIVRVAKRIFRTSGPSVASIGPVSHLESYSSIKKRFL